MYDPKDCFCTLNFCFETYHNFKNETRMQKNGTAEVESTLK